MELRYCEACGDVVQVETDQAISLADHFLCKKCSSSPGDSSKKTVSGEINLKSVLEGPGLNLFSNDTIALRKKQHEHDVASKKPKSTRLRLVKQEAGEADGSSTALEEGCATPAKSAQKILFRCLHCRSTLSIRPVDKISKLTCPQCGNSIYVTASGQLSKDSPSIRLRNTESTGTEKPGSSASKQGSSSLPRTPSTPPLPVARAGSIGSATAKKAGSEGIAKPGTSRAVIKPPSSRPVPIMQAEKRQSSRRLAKLSSGQAPGAAADDVKLTDVNPAGNWASRPTSAFEEHRTKNDPEKTAFITEEATGDFTGIAPVLKAAGQAKKTVRLPGSERAAPSLPSAGPSTREGHKEESKTESETIRKFGRTSLFRGLQPSADKEASPPRAPSARRPFERLARAFVLFFCLSAPLLLAGGLLTREAPTKGKTKAESTPSFLGRLGDRTVHGTQRLASWVGLNNKKK